MLNKLIVEAQKVLDGGELSKDTALGLSKITGENIIDVISLANKVKSRFSPEIHVCTITNAKSGSCNEDCSYCAQSVHHKAPIDIYPLESKEKILSDAIKAYENGIRKFGIVTSGLGYLEINSEFKNIISSIDYISGRFPDMEICASLGVLCDDTAKLLAVHGVKEYNHNLQVSPEKYGRLVSTTHDVKDRINTLGLVKKYGIKVCSGGIIGLGENMEDRVNLAFTLKELDVDIIPLNVLVPIEGTPLENMSYASAAQTALTFSIFRLVNPGKVIKFAAGRESVMKDFQGLLMLAGVNGFLTGGYLTIRGRDPVEDNSFIRELGGFGVFS